jgi:hypothetical protein
MVVWLPAQIDARTGLEAVAVFKHPAASLIVLNEKSPEKLSNADRGLNKSGDRWLLDPPRGAVA